jgi:hypothetical protein
LNNLYQIDTVYVWPEQPILASKWDGFIFDGQVREHDLSRRTPHGSEPSNPAISQRVARGKGNELWVSQDLRTAAGKKQAGGLTGLPIPSIFS